MQGELSKTAAELKLLKWPDLRLREVAELVGENDTEVPTLAAVMLELCDRSKNGIGLSATQCGIAKAFCVIKLGGKLPGAEAEHGLMKSWTLERYLVLINPEITAVSRGKSRAFEGCLSLPGLEVDVERHNEVVVRYEVMGEGGLKSAAPLRFDGMLGRCVQHEIDHLQGTLITDHASPQCRRRLGARFKIPPMVQPVRKTVGVIDELDESPEPARNTLGLTRAAALSAFAGASRSTIYEGRFA